MKKTSKKSPKKKPKRAPKQKPQPKTVKNFPSTWPMLPITFFVPNPQYLTEDYSGGQARGGEVDPGSGPQATPRGLRQAARQAMRVGG